MRRKPSYVAAIAVALFLSACLGTATRADVLWPLVSSTWPAISSNVEAGLKGREPTPAEAAALNQVEGAVRADDHALLRGVNWPALESLARRGVRVRVQGGEVSEGVSASLLERIKKFSEAMKELTAR